ncbi:MAG: N-acetylmuramidase domain-containing protein [bacterium]
MFATIKLLKKNTRHRHLAKQLQAMLAVMNYSLDVDGAFGNGTKTAVEAFQKANNLSADGIVGKQTWLILYQELRHCLAQLAYPKPLPEKEKEVFGTSGELFVKLDDPTTADTPASLHWLQAMIYLLDNEATVTGQYDAATQAFIQRFKNDCDLTADYCVDDATWQALFTRGLVAVNEVAPLFITDEMIEQIAQEEDLESAAIKAVIKVESRGSGFYEDKRPVILFEGHIFWRELKKVGIDPNTVRAGNEDIIYPKWVREHYKGTANGEYDRLERAKAIHPEAALRSASWGMFQIMGFNHQASGYDTVTHYVDNMYANEYEQIKAFIRFLHSENIYRHLKNKDWASFARRYNGPAYKKNGYDWKLQVAFDANASGARGDEQVEVIVNEYTNQLMQAFADISAAT